MARRCADEWLWVGRPRTGFGYDRISDLDDDVFAKGNEFISKGDFANAEMFFERMAGRTRKRVLGRM